MAENLRPEGIPVTVGNVRISTPGLAGRVEVYQPGSAGMRGAESSTAPFRQALDDAGMVEQLTVEISGQRELDASGGSRGGGGVGRPAVAGRWSRSTRTSPRRRVAGRSTASPSSSAP